MWNSRLKSLSFLFVFLTLTACWKPLTSKDDRAKVEKGSADFNVVQITISNATPSSDMSQDWRVDNAKMYSFAICLKDRVYGSEIKFQDFQLRDHTDDLIENATTDKDGCFIWKKKIYFNYFAKKPSYAILKATVVGKGLFKGEREINLALNPWAPYRGGGKEVLDLSKEPLPPGVSTELTDSVSSTVSAQQILLDKVNSEKTPLWIDDLSVHISRVQEIENAVDLELNFEMKPQLVLETLAGRPKYENLLNGRFRVFAQLVATNVGENSDEKVILTPNVPSEVATIVGGKLRSQLTARLSRRVARGRIVLALKIVPMNAPSNVDSYEAVYLLVDSFQDIIGKRSPTLRPEAYKENSQFDYHDYLANTSNFDELKKASEAYMLSPYDFHLLDLRFERIMAQTATERTIAFRATSCVTDTLTGRPVRDIRFDFEGPDGRKFSKVTQADGCMYWQDSITHKYYKPENLKIIILKVSQPHSNFKTEVGMAVNPWDDKWTFGRDIRQLSEDYILEIKTRQFTESRFYIAGFSYHTIRFRYEIDQFMNLVVKKNLLLRFDPFALRYNSIIYGRGATEPLRDGIYLMKVALEKPYLDPAAKGVEISYSGDGSHSVRYHRRVKRRRYVTAVKKLVRVQNGQVITPIELSMRDLRLMRIRSQFLIQMETIDEKKLLANNTADKAIQKLDELRNLSEEEMQARYAERDKLVGALLARLNDASSGLNYRPKNPKEEERLFRQFSINKDVLDELKKNDFTVGNIDTENVESVIETDSGLTKRTFVGPLTLIYNTNASHMRPTDNPSEMFCLTVDDCNLLPKEKQELLKEQVASSPESAAYKDSPYFGSIKHLIGKHVDDLIEVWKKQEVAYVQKMKAESLLYNYLTVNHLKFVSAANAPLEKWRPDCSARKADDCLVATDERTVPVEKFLLSDSKARIWQAEEVGKESNKDLIETRRNELLQVIRGGELTDGLAEKLCLGLAEEFSAAAVGEGVYTIREAKSSRRYLVAQCQRRLRSGKTSEHPFVLEPKYRVFKTGEYVFLGGKPMNINVGSSFQLKHSVSSNRGIGFFTPFPGAKLGVGTDAERSESDGLSVNEQTFLVMQKASISIVLTEYEKCVVAKWAEEFLDDLGLLGKISASGVESLRSAGFMLCTGEIEGPTSPEEYDKHRVIEEYYYFTQHFTDGDMLDPGDLYNHPWLLALRGIGDFQRFAQAIRAKIVPEKYYLKPWDSVVEEEAWPIKKLINVYYDFAPTFPGLYTPFEAGKDYPVNGNVSELMKTQRVGLEEGFIGD